MLRRVILLAALVSYAASAIDTCKPKGEYCQNHWDCCTGTCLSYLYKCSSVQRPRPASGSVAIFAPAAIPTISPETQSLNDLIQSVFGNKKTGKEINSLDSRFSEDKPTTSKSNDDATIAPNDFAQTTIADSELDNLESTFWLDTPTAYQILQRNRRQINDNNIEEDQPTTLDPVTEAPRCLEIGSKCYFNEECCTTRCHGFLHQCVT